MASVNAPRGLQIAKKNGDGSNSTGIRTIDLNGASPAVASALIPSDIFTGNNAALTSYIESADFDLQDGNELIFMDKLIPDFDINTGNIKFSIQTKQYPESSQSIEKGPFTISNTTNKVSLRARGRQAKIRVSCDSTGTKWRWGSLRLAMQPDGGR